jgi:branched-chain amino acid transport system ATP-binding protein
MSEDIILQTQDLSRYFGGLKAVDGVDLKVFDGHLHSIIGPNGAGKTTLFNLLSGAMKPTHGRVLLRDQDITDFPPHKTAHFGLGRSYQITNIFPNLTVLENVRLAAQALCPDNFKLFSRAGNFRRYEQTAYRALEQTQLLDSAVLPARTLPQGDKRRL